MKKLSAQMLPPVWQATKQLKEETPLQQESLTLSGALREGRQVRFVMVRPRPAATTFVEHRGDRREPVAIPTVTGVMPVTTKKDHHDRLVHPRPRADLWLLEKALERIGSVRPDRHAIHCKPRPVSNLSQWCVSEHVPQLCHHNQTVQYPRRVDNCFNHWLLFDDLWASAHLDLANSLLRQLDRWLARSTNCSARRTTCRPAIPRHSFPPDARQKAYEFLDRHLKGER